MIYLSEIDKCSMDPPVCSQNCINTRPGGYECSCVDGYQLASDRRRCVVASPRWKSWKRPSTALVFYTQSGRVISRSVQSGGSSKLVYRATGLVSALGLYCDLHCHTQFLVLKRNSRRRRDATVESSCVGVSGV